MGEGRERAMSNQETVWIRLADLQRRLQEGTPVTVQEVRDVVRDVRAMAETMLSVADGIEGILLGQERREAAKEVPRAVET